MSPIEIIALLALVAYAIYRQTQRREVVGHGRFKLAIIYAAVGLLVGGFQRPDSAAEVALLATSLALKRRRRPGPRPAHPRLGRSRRARLLRRALR